MMNPRAPSRRGAALRTRPRLASGIAARSKSGLLRRAGRIALYGVIGFIIGSIVLVALYRVGSAYGRPPCNAAGARPTPLRDKSSSFPSRLDVVAEVFSDDFHSW